jgi:hypothetical protein
VARVVAYVPDLLFGSNVLGMLQAGGHEADLVSQPGPVAEGTDVVVVDLTADATARIAQIGAQELHGARVLAFYSHVEADVRAEAEEAGFDLVIPRSRMAREGAQLVERLSGR